MRQIAQATAYTVMLKVVLSADHFTAATGKTVAIKLSKDGGAFADPHAGATNATEVSSGWYKVALDQTDTATLGDLVVRGTAASCDDSEQICQVTFSAWDEDTSEHNNGGSFGAYLQIVGGIVDSTGDAVDELHTLHGLSIPDPVTVTPTLRTAGTISQTISGNGTTTSTVTRTA